MKVQVFAHSQKLIIVPSDPEQGINDRWWPTGGKNGNHLGCVLGDSKARLGVSREALEIMQSIKCGRDAVGDIDWWACDDGTYAFSWWGPIHRIIDPSNAIAARGFGPYPDQCVIIENNVPANVLKDVLECEFAVSWREPTSLKWEYKK